MKERREFRILVVDDNSAFRLSLQKILAGLGFAVQTANDGAEALQLLEQETVHLVFSDLRMPKMTGLELLKRIKQLYPEIQVVLVTAYCDLMSEVEAMRLDACGCLCKPIKRHDILEALEKFCGLDIGLAANNHILQPSLQGATK